MDKDLENSSKLYYQQVVMCDCKDSSTGHIKMFMFLDCESQVAQNNYL